MMQLNGNLRLDGVLLVCLALHGSGETSTLSNVANSGDLALLVLYSL